MSDRWQRCGHCRWWDATERTEAVEHMEQECHRRPPHAGTNSTGPSSKLHRVFPILRGDDGCGDYQPAGMMAYRADYREKLGPWFRMDERGSFVLARPQDCGYDAPWSPPSNDFSGEKK